MEMPDSFAMRCTAFERREEYPGTAANNSSVSPAGRRYCSAYQFRKSAPRLISGSSSRSDCRTQFVSKCCFALWTEVLSDFIVRGEPCPYRFSISLKATERDVIVRRCAMWAFPVFADVNLYFHNNAPIIFGDTRYAAAASASSARYFDHDCCESTIASAIYADA